MTRPPGAAGLLALLLLSPLTRAAAPNPPPPPAIAARSHVLIDFNTGKVLAAQNEHERLEPASLTKLMTAYAVFKALQQNQIKLTDNVVVSERAWREGGAASGGSATFLPINSTASVEIMLKGMIIQSGNDASIALAEHLSGSEEAFSDLMNRYAKELGMNDSHFMNSAGLPHPDHYSSAADIATLGRALIAEFPQYYAWYSVKEFTFNGIKQGNRNLLLYRDPTVDGIKTGHTDKAGYCLASSAKRGDMRLIAVVMGSASPDARAKASLELLNYGFRFFETRRLFQAGASIAKARVWKGTAETVELGIPADLWVTVPRGAMDQLQARTDAPRDVTAPISSGTEIGTIKVTLAGEPLVQTPLVPLQPVAAGSLWRRSVDTVLLWFE